MRLGKKITGAAGLLFCILALNACYLRPMPAPDPWPEEPPDTRAQPQRATIGGAIEAFHRDGAEYYVLKADDGRFYFIDEQCSGADNRAAMNRVYYSGRPGLSVEGLVNKRGDELWLCAENVSVHYYPLAHEIVNKEFGTATGTLRKSIGQYWLWTVDGRVFKIIPNGRTTWLLENSLKDRPEVDVAITGQIIEFGDGDMVLQLTRSSSFKKLGGLWQ